MLVVRKKQMTSLNDVNHDFSDDFKQEHMVLCLSQAEWLKIILERLFPLL